MSVAIDERAPESSAAGSGLGTVTVCHFGPARSRAGCSCGWSGKRRVLRAAATQDAWLHSIHERCEVAVPLVRPAVS